MVKKIYKGLLSEFRLSMEICGNKRIFLFVFIFILLSSIVNSATYYLSPTGSDVTGDGSYDNPWFSPKEARRSNGIIEPGDEIVFKDGSYVYNPAQDHFDLLASDGGTFDGKIIYKAEHPGKAVLNFSCVHDYAIRLYSPNVILDGFTIIEAYSIINIYAQNITIRNVNMTGTYSWPPSENVCTNIEMNGRGGVLSDADADNFLIENCIIDRISDEEGYHGTYFVSGSGIVRNTTIRNVVGAGLLVQQKGAGKPISWIKIYNNKIYDNNGTGISIYAHNSSGSNATILNAEIFNNVVWHNGFNGIKTNGAGIIVTGKNDTEFGVVKNVRVYHNTVFNNINGMFVGVIVYNISVKNNLFFNNTRDDYGWTNSYDVLWGEIDESNNVLTDISKYYWWSGHKIPAQYYNNVTLKNFLGDPEFVSLDMSSNDFIKLSSSSLAINNGTYLGIDYDFYGNERDSNPDIGAYEYVESNYPKSLYVDIDSIGGGCSNSYTREENSIIRPWCDINTAHRELGNVEPGDIVYIRAGTYIGQNTFTNLDNGTKNNPITYRSYPGETTLIDVQNSNYAFDLQNTAYLAFEGFEIINSQRAVFHPDDSHYIIIRNNNIHNCKVYGSGALSGTPNPNPQSTNIIFTNNSVHDIGTSNGDHCMYIINQKDLEISNNIFKNCFQVLIQPHCDNPPECARLDKVDNVTIKNNKLIDVSLKISFDPGNIDYCLVTNVSIYNNIFYGNTSSGIIANQAPMKIYHNTIFGKSSGISFGHDTDNCSGNIEVINNIIYASVLYDIEWAPSTNYTKIIQYNNIMSTYYYWSGHPPDPYWTNLLNSNYNVDPLFVDVSVNNFTLLSTSPAIDNATNVSIYSDYYGNERPQGGSFDIGAYEYLNMPIYHKADLDHSGVIEDSETKSFWQRWMSNLESFSDMFDVLRVWKSG